MEKARRYLNEKLGDTKLGVHVVQLMHDFANEVDPRLGECEFKINWQACKKRTGYMNGCSECENFVQKFAK